MEEIWKIIPGTYEKYSVSNLGRVRRNEHYTDVRPDNYHFNWRKHHYKEKVLKPYTNSDGYKVVTLQMSGGWNMVRRVHTLVAEAFVPNPENKPCVNHKNEIRDDNRADNLEWCTVEYNNRYGTRTEKIRKSSGKRVAQYDLQGNLIKIWNSISEAMRSFGCNGNSGISRVCRGVAGRKTYKGFVWKYVDESVLNKKQVLDYLETSLSKDELLEVINHLQKIYDKK